MPIQHTVYARQNIQRAIRALDEGNNDVVRYALERAIDEIRNIRPKQVG